MKNTGSVTELSKLNLWRCDRNSEQSRFQLCAEHPDHVTTEEINKKAPVQV